MRNTRSTRLFVGLAFWLIASAHQRIFADVPNTPGGMLVYHGGAALFDFATLVISARLLTGRLSDDLQSLCLIAMIVNFTGWILYLAYIPPAPYNYALLGVGCVQYLRLLLGDLHGADNLRSDLVYRRDFSSPKLHAKEANK